jgi:hypothetical protein
MRFHVPENPYFETLEQTKRNIYVVAIVPTATAAIFMEGW